MEIKIKQLVLISFIVGALTLNATAFAAIGEPLDLPVCAEGVFPYNPGGNPPSNDPEQNDKYINEHTEATCRAHTKYDNPHKTITTTDKVFPTHKVTQAAKDDNIHLPITEHTHIHYNNSTSKNDDFYYVSYIGKFEIVLESDARTNTYSDQIICPVFGDQVIYNIFGSDEKKQIYQDFKNCKHDAYDPNILGGVKLTNQKTSGNRIRLTWEFGVNGQGGRPQLHGISEEVDTNAAEALRKIDFDTTNPVNRSFFESVRMTSQDKPLEQKIWPATTNSKILIVDAFLAKDNVDNWDKDCENGGWCVMQSEDYPSDHYIHGADKYTLFTNGIGTEYFWATIGTVATVWMEQEKPAPVCLDLKITSPDRSLVNTNGKFVGNTPYDFHVEPTFKDGIIPLDYIWSSQEVGLNQHNFQPGFGTKILGANIFGNLSDFISDSFENSNKPRNLLALDFPNEVDPSDQPADALDPNSPPQFNFPDEVDPSDQPPNVFDPNSPPKFNIPIGNDEIDPSDQPPNVFDPNSTPKFNIPINPSVNTILGLFYDFFGSNDFGNPYTDTGINVLGVYGSDKDVYYTGGNSRDENHAILVRVEAIDHNTGEYLNNCDDEILVYHNDNIPPPPTEEDILTCIDLVVDFTPSPFDPTGSTQITAKPIIKNQNGQIVAYTDKVYFESENGTGNFVSGQTNGNPINASTVNSTATTTFSNGLPNESINIRPSDPAFANIAACKKTINPLQIPPPLVCDDLEIHQQNTGLFPSNILLNDPTFPTNNLFSVVTKSAALELDYKWSATSNNTATGQFTTVDAITNATYGPANPLTNPNANDLTAYSNASTQNATTVKVEAFDQTDPSLGVVCSDQFTITPPTPVGEVPFCLDLFLQPQQINPINQASNFVSNVTFSNGLPQNTEVTWTANGGTFSNGQSAIIQNQSSATTFNATFTPTNNIASVTAKVTNATTFTSLAGCESTFNINLVGPPPPPPPENIIPPTLEKEAQVMGDIGFSKSVLNVSYDDTDVIYKLTFTALSATSGTITDTISNTGKINGEFPPLFVNSAGLVPGYIEYLEGTTVVSPQDGECNPSIPNDTNCYTGDSILDGIRLNKFQGQIVITYQGRIRDSKVDENNCNDALVCEEIYQNAALASYTTYDSNGNIFNNLPGFIQSKPIKTQRFCQYILSRAAGDIFLETDLEAGIDIYKCAPFKSTTGIIITPEAPEGRTAPGTGGTEDPLLVPIGHNVCKGGSTDNEKVKSIFDNNSTDISSSVCELKFRPDSKWDKTTIVRNIEENKTRISRFEPNLNAWSNIINSFSDLPQSSNNVYHLTGNDLILGNGTSDLILKDGEVGATTIIVEGGDVIIRSNMKYGACDGFCTTNQRASLAIVVLDGNVIIDKDVEELVGVYFVQEGDQGTGKLISGTKVRSTIVEQISKKTLTILGSVFGDIEPLLKKRTFAGENQLGSITIRFDQRIIQNTPPGLKEIVDVTEEVGGF